MTQPKALLLLVVLSVLLVAGYMLSERPDAIDQLPWHAGEDDKELHRLDGSL